MNVLLLRIVLCSLGSGAVLGIGNDAETLTYVIRNNDNNLAQINERKTGPESGEVARRWYRAYKRINAHVDYARARGTAAPFWLAIRTLVNSINATSLRLKTMETRIMSRFGDEQDGSSNCIESETANSLPASHRRASCKRREEKLDSAMPASLVTQGGGYDSSKPSSLNMLGRRNSNHRLKRSAASRRKNTFKYERTKRETSEPLHTLFGPPLATEEAMTRPLAFNQSTDFPFDVTTHYELFTFPDEDQWETTTNIIPLNTLENAHIPKNPFYPITRESYGAYAVACVSVVIFTVGVVGNIATMCIVCHNYYMRSISNWLIANLALWDVLLLVFCLPLVVYQQLTKEWLLGDFSCKAVPYVEVVSLGVSTFTLCALCVDRFRSAASAHARYESVESCGSTAAKLAVVWIGALLLALPELVIHQLVPEDGAGRRCAVRVSPALPDAAYALGLTYLGARLWWLFGCYFCLPSLFAAGGALVAAGRLRRAERAGLRGSKQRLRLERHMNRALVALAILHAVCVAPESARHAVSAHMAAAVPPRAADLLWLASQLLLISRAAAAPVLLFCLCRPFGHALQHCCCCCCRRREGAPQRPGQNDVCPQTAELELAPVSSANTAAAATGTDC